MSLPRVIVFDLDGTLWVPEMYELWGSGGAPFKPHPSRPDTLLDRRGTPVQLLGNSYLLLATFVDPSWRQRHPRTHFALASTCDEPEWARDCLKKFDINGTKMGDIFDFHEIYKAYSKAKHFESILRKAQKVDPGISFNDFIFFDNQTNNCRDVAPLGVTCVYTPEGMTEAYWERGLHEWRKARGECR